MTALKRAIPFALLASMLLPTLFYWQNACLQVSSYVYTSQKVGPGLDGYKIVQISDLHNADFGRNNHRLIAAIAKLAPDMIILTGDTVDSYAPEPQMAVSFVQAALGLAPVYYVTGNHELRLPAETLRAFEEGIAFLGAVVLDDASVRIKHNGETLELLGLAEGSLKSDMLDKLVDSLPKDSLKVLLAHEPQYLPEYSRAGVDLVFSGHAHGGQFRLPFIDGLYAPSQGFFPRYTCGLYTMGNTTMAVSRGLGNSVIHCRIGNRPDIVLLTLRPANG